MAAFGDECFEAFAGLRNGVRSRDADRVETVRARLIAQRACDFGRFLQKSRSA
jgi:hypothetical protein